MLDRIDLGIEVPALPAGTLSTRHPGDFAQGPQAAGTSSKVREETTRARDFQLARQGKPNARLGPREIDAHCAPDAAGAALLAQAMSRLSLSARAYHRILKVARTIADLAGSADIGTPHVAEAIGYRRFDRI